MQKIFYKTGGFRLKKALSVFMAAAMMTAFSTSAKEEINSLSHNDYGIISVASATPRLSSTTVRKSLTTDAWTLLYSDNNWLDARAQVTNNSGNTGSIIVRVVTVEDGQKDIFDTSVAVAAGLTYTSPKIASSYDQYLIYVKAASKAGSFSITYDDV